MLGYELGSYEWSCVIRRFDKHLEQIIVILYNEFVQYYDTSIQRFERNQDDLEISAYFLQLKEFFVNEEF